MNAWIDCMGDLDADGGMTSVQVAPGELLTLQFDHAKAFAARCPWHHQALLECTDFVNARRTERGGHALLALAFTD